MSEALEKVIGVKFLPLFPLPLVLLPNEFLPLHIFEPRYRRMLEDIRLEKNLFGLSYFEGGETDSTQPDVGSCGCVAEVREVQPLEDGRSNIVTVGVVRYRLENYVEADEPYLVGEVSFFEDEDEDDQILEPVANEVFGLFRRIARAAHELSGDRGKFPEIPETSPQTLSFLVSAAFNFQPGVKYELLKMRSTFKRLERLREMLKDWAVNVEESARINRIAKTNGHSAKKINLE